MTIVTFEMSEDKTTFCFRARGHANGGKKGEDPLCASVSILAYTLAQNAKFLYDAKWLRRKPHIRIKDGNMEVTCKPKKDYYNEVLHTFNVIAVGYKLLNTNFPDNIKLVMDMT